MGHILSQQVQRVELTGLKERGNNTLLANMHKKERSKDSNHPGNSKIGGIKEPDCI